MAFINSTRNIVHYDLDSFFVSVECLKNDKLKGKPIAVGGSSERGVIASCSYEARKYGVHSAMPVKLAKRLCPDLLIIKGDSDSYSKYSRLVTDVIAGSVPLFEKSSIDEFYVDMSGMDKFFGCALYTKELRKKIEKESGLNISYGLASNKLISKVATDEAKPHGQLEIPFGFEKSFLAPLPVEKLPMVGPKTSTLLKRMGVETINILSQIPLDMMTNLMGKNGIELHRRSNGIDETPIVPFHEQKSIGTEQTFESDTIDTYFMYKELVRMTEGIAFELRSQNKLTGCITVKIRYSDFQTFTKQESINYTSADHVLLKKVKELFSKLYSRRQLIRLIGVRLTDLVPGNYQINLFDDTQELIKLYQAIDSVKSQYGEPLLMRASGFDKTEKHRRIIDKVFKPFKF
jgi:DNA polymerase IV